MFKLLLSSSCDRNGRDNFQPVSFHQPTAATDIEARSSTRFHNAGQLHTADSSARQFSWNAALKTHVSNVFDRNSGAISQVLPKNAAGGCVNASETVNKQSHASYTEGTCMYTHSGLPCFSPELRCGRSSKHFGKSALTRVQQQATHVLFSWRDTLTLFDEYRTNSVLKKFKTIRIVGNQYTQWQQRDQPAENCDQGMEESVWNDSQCVESVC